MEAIDEDLYELESEIFEDLEEGHLGQMVRLIVQSVMNRFVLQRKFSEMRTLLKSPALPATK